MSLNGSVRGSRLAEGSLETLKLMALLMLALILMVSDHRGDWLSRFRSQAERVVEPLYRLAAVPGWLIESGHDLFASRRHLTRENRDLSQQLLLARAREGRLQAVVRENARLRELLGGTRGYQIDVRLASILDIDLDPFRHRVVIDQGANQGVEAGQALIDGGGVVGQVILAAANHATALLITDPDHAVPVQVVRSGLRLLAYGSGERDRLRLLNIPQSGDIRPGDQLVTSGIGGTFPAGFAVGVVIAVEDDPVRQFRLATVVPAAALDRSGEVLLVWSHAIEEEQVGPRVIDQVPGSTP